MKSPEHLAPPPIPPQLADRYWQATLHRDSQSDGSFVFAVRSTQIYCRPSCPARRPLRHNTLFFHTPQDAEQQGFRACQRCRPNHLDPAIMLVRQAASMLASSQDEAFRLTLLASRLKSSPAQLRRAFHRVTGLAPKEFEQAFRLRKLKQLLRGGSSIADALYACGYGSSSRLYEKTNSHLGMTPASYRKGGEGMKIGFTVGNSTLGKVLVASTDRGVSAVYLGENEKELVSALREEYPKAELLRADHGHDDWLKEILHRVEGTAPSMDLPLDVQATAFQRRVWNELQKIPRGTTRTYTQVAQALGRPDSVRAVARACATNPVSIIVPCHRVIRTDGALAGYRWGLQRKQKLLEREAQRA
ncbi:MAG TPA: bifunctional DNA-binding transcriptional regulator/O6-methylguanine-DNA methyltransferase Ada [Candidatus Saccharimonadales bacterium]|nr:bifunctional DNA-binding transcriptional regulator/O6-methylguanine-DNA methyltransferase Ada [Candidatus Saccharimonadales bacterium]